MVSVAIESVASATSVNVRMILCESRKSDSVGSSTVVRVSKAGRRSMR